MASDELKRLITKAVGDKTPAGYHQAQAEVAVLLLSCQLGAEYQRIAVELINTTNEDLAPLFAEALRELQGMERLRIFEQNIGNLSAEMRHLIGLSFPGVPATLATRILVAAAEGDVQAKMIVGMYSKTEEEMEAMMATRIPVRIVPDRNQ